jgi:protocatechuate 4,5-dioxygenase beta chain
MARLVLGLGAPHTPHFPTVAMEQGEASRVTVLFNRLREELEAAAPDLILVYTSDHFVSFFFDNMPTFCIGAFDAAEGPRELSRSTPHLRVTGHPPFAAALFEYGLENGFDLASAEELELDHSLLVPLYFLTPKMNVPVVPIYIRGLAEPLPSAQRCYSLGQMVRRQIDRWPGAERIAVVASGSFSLEVGGPKMGWIDHEWFDFVVERIRQGNTADLLRRASTRRMIDAGNTGGELLDWIALLGTLGGSAATFIEPDSQPPESPRDAHAYAAWRIGA